MLQAAGGVAGKAALFERLKADFSAELGTWPEGLDDRDGANRTRASSAFAFALSRLVMAKVMEPSGRSDRISLLAASDRTVSSQDADEDPSLSRTDIAMIERSVRQKAAARLRFAIDTGLPHDPDFVEQSIAAVRASKYRCALSGVPFNMRYRTDGAGGGHLAPSPDRVDPAMGYTGQNVVWILWCLNRGKGRMNSEKFLEIFRATKDAVAFE